MVTLFVYIALYVIICVKSDLTEEVGWHKVSQGMLIGFDTRSRMAEREELLFPLMSNIEEIVPPIVSWSLGLEAQA